MSIDRTESLGIQLHGARSGSSKTWATPRPGREAPRISSEHQAGLWIPERHGHAAEEQRQLIEAAPRDVELVHGHAGLVGHPRWMVAEL